MNEKLKEYVTDYLDIFVAKGHSVMSKGNNNKEYPNLYWIFFDSLGLDYIVLGIQF